MSIEAMKQALEALETNETTAVRYAAATSLRQAIAQAQEKEPCTRVECMGNSGCIGYCWNKKQPQRQPLTDEQIETLAKQHFAKDERSFKSCARAIEAAHGIKGESDV